VRQVGLCDLHHAARAVQIVPCAYQTDVCRVIIWRAHVADKYVKRLGKLHPEWGDGSLRAAALMHPCAPVQSGATRDYLAALACVTSCLLDRAKIFRPTEVCTVARSVK